jgi:hypothetical protein
VCGAPEYGGKDDFDLVRVWFDGVDSSWASKHDALLSTIGSTLFPHGLNKARLSVEQVGTTWLANIVAVSEDPMIQICLQRIGDADRAGSDEDKDRGGDRGGGSKGNKGNRGGSSDDKSAPKSDSKKTTLAVARATVMPSVLRAADLVTRLMIAATRRPLLPTRPSKVSRTRTRMRRCLTKQRSAC